MIRRSAPRDRGWITAVAAGVYRDLGDYARIIPSWLDHPGVLAYVEQSEERKRERRAFLLLGFYEPPEELRGRFVADLLAIAVAPQFQRRGIGRAMLDHAIRVAEVAGAGGRVAEIRLTVADGNEIGQRLYLSSGFRILDEEHGFYDGGQRAIRMTRRLAPRVAARPRP